MYTTVEATTKLGTDNTREETPIQLNKMFCTDTKSKERVLRSLSPEALESMPPLGLYFLMRVIASGDRASLE